MVKWLNDPKNDKEAIELGLKTKVQSTDTSNGASSGSEPSTKVPVPDKGGSDDGQGTQTDTSTN